MLLFPILFVKNKSGLISINLRNKNELIFALEIWQVYIFIPQLYLFPRAIMHKYGMN